MKGHPCTRGRHRSRHATSSPLAVERDDLYIHMAARLDYIFLMARECERCRKPSFLKNDTGLVRTSLRERLVPVRDPPSHESAGPSRVTHNVIHTCTHTHKHKAIHTPTTFPRPHTQCFQSSFTKAHELTPPLGHPRCVSNSSEMSVSLD